MHTDCGNDNLLNSSGITAFINKNSDDRKEREYLLLKER